jgi:RimJ/RimL family protein N-acetyltransferase
VADSVVLRRASADDLERTFAWANDPVTRAVSFTSAPIRYAEHVAWFERQLSDHKLSSLLCLLIAEHHDQPIGVVRLQPLTERESTCVISINIAPEARGRGLGVATLVAATPRARELGFDRIRALIRPDNHASVRAFVGAGYVQVGSTHVGEHEALVLERPCAD